MIKLDHLPKTTSRGKKRRGQGTGSGKGKTAGRGTKGQKSRGKISKTAAMGHMALFKRLPLKRGKYRNKPSTKRPLVVNVKYLNILSKNSVVDVAALVAKGIVKNDEGLKYGIKILGDGNLTVPLIVKLPCSKGASSKINKAGGKVEVNG